MAVGNSPGQSSGVFRQRSVKAIDVDVVVANAVHLGEAHGSILSTNLKRLILDGGARGGKEAGASGRESFRANRRGQWDIVRPKRIPTPSLLLNHKDQLIRRTRP